VVREAVNRPRDGGRSTPMPLDRKRKKALIAQGLLLSSKTWGHPTRRLYRSRWELFEQRHATYRLADRMSWSPHQIGPMIEKQIFA